MLRRRLLQGAVASAGILLGTGGLAAAGGATGPSRTRVRLGFVGNPCEAATFMAPDSAIFERNGLEARTIPFQTTEALIAGLDSGAIDAASLNLPELLKPLESGAHVRVVAGLHAGCLRVVAPIDFFGLTRFADLKGWTIATDRLHGPSMNLFSALLRRQGLDPQHDVSWEVLDEPALDAALQSNGVACVAASDPLGYVLLKEKKAKAYLNTADGGFSCGGDIAHGHHCFLALSGRLVDARPALASALARAYLATSTAIGRGVGPAALAEVRGGYVEADMYGAIGMLSSYDWSPSTDFVLEELELTARDFRRAGLLKRDTDPERLADRAFADVLHA